MDMISPIIVRMKTPENDCNVNSDLHHIKVDFRQSVSVRLCVRASHACVRKSRCEGGAKLHGFVRANVRAFRVFWVRHTRAITLEIFQ